jgi:Leucine-rich repeat (LRR) protein
MIGSLKNLERLDIGGTKVTDLGMSRIARLSKLTDLNGSRTAVGTAGIAALTKLPLTKVSLWRASKVDDSTAAALASFPGLRSMDLSETALTDIGLASLAKLRLEYLYVRGTKVSEQGVAAFRKENPECFVSWQ